MLLKNTFITYDVCIFLIFVINKGMNQLQNNRLILNWHRIFSITQLFDFLSKKFWSETNSISWIENILSNYENLNIAIWHSDTFLKDETIKKHDEIIKILEKHWIVKQTWKIKKI